ncbi:MAG: PorV/PorQ family protein [Cryomorphaceae bacterium]|nr:PorV/PorQ family protein [Cryomorphaceae bacterium]
MIKPLKVLGLALAIASVPVYAGNPQRVGSAGAAELLINPWAQSAGTNNANIGGTRGVEAMFLNVAGMAFTEGTEVSFTNTQWLVGADMFVNAFGLTQRVGANGVLGLSLTNINYGDIDVRTVNNPDGGLGTFSPNASIITASYAQRFTDAIYGGVNLKVFNQSLSNLSATALCVDAGIQYVTGEDDKIKFGITLRNIGPSVAFSGDGFDVSLPVPGGGYTQSWQSRSAPFELPSNLNLGGSYDFDLDTDLRFTVMGSFNSHSFQKDEYHVGGEFAFQEKFMLRAGYIFFDDRADSRHTNAFTGFASGISMDLPLSSGNDNTRFALDFAYRATRSPFMGTYSMGVRMMF